MNKEKWVILGLGLGLVLWIAGVVYMFGNSGSKDEYNKTVPEKQVVKFKKTYKDNYSNIGVTEIDNQNYQEDYDNYNGTSYNYDNYRNYNTYQDDNYQNYQNQNTTYTFSPATSQTYVDSTGKQIRIKCQTYINTNLISLNARNIPSEVKKMEEFLRLYYDNNSIPVDGYYTEEDVQLVKEYQAEKGLKVDGVVGRNTLRQMNLDYCVKKYVLEHKNEFIKK